MPTLPPTLIFSLEASLILAGCWLLWLHGLSPAGRARCTASAANMPIWRLTPHQFLLFLWVAVCGGMLLQALASLGLRGTALGETATLIIAGGSLHGGMLLGVLVFKLAFERAAAQAPTPHPWPRILFYGFVTLLIALPVLAITGFIWQNALHFLGVPFEEQDLIGIFARTKSPLLLSLMIFLATVVAPMAEELIFRGGLFRYARHRLPRWLALVGPAIIFGALHLNLASFAPLVVLGVLLSFAYERTGNIAVPIVAHGLFNLNTILMILAGIGT